MGSAYNAGAAWEAYLAANAFASLRRQRHFSHELHLLAIVALSFLVLSDVPGALRPAHSAAGHDCVCTRSDTSQMAFSS